MSWIGCPECGGKASCIDSRPYHDAVRRRYKCESDHRWTTLERMAERRPQNMELVTANGRTMTIAAWAKKLKVSEQGLMRRLYLQKLHPDVAMRKGRASTRRSLIMISSAEAKESG
jgi:hypothetical protein